MKSVTKIRGAMKKKFSQKKWQKLEKKDYKVIAEK